MTFIFFIFLLNFIYNFPQYACYSSVSVPIDIYPNPDNSYNSEFKRVRSDNDGVKVLPLPQVSYREEEINVPVVSYEAEAVSVPAETQEIKVFPDSKQYIDDFPCDDYSARPLKSPFEKSIGQIVVNSLQISQASYIVDTITLENGMLVESPQWSSEEAALYWTDKYAQIIYRYSPKENDLSSRKIYYGPTSAVFPVKDAPGIILVAVRNELFLLKWGAPGDDFALRQVSVVDIGLPNNMISAGKVDTNGRLWFGTQGTGLGKLASIVPDEATIYSVSYKNFEYPDIKVRPGTEIGGFTWSLDSKKLFYSDGPTRKIIQYDFILETGEIGNGTVFLDFYKENLLGYPNGITIDKDGNLWVATVNGSQILKIDPDEGYIIDEILLPVDQVTSLIWGGKDYRTLYVTTGSRLVKNPMPLSGCLFAITNTGTGGLINYGFKFPDANTY